MKRVSNRFFGFCQSNNFYIISLILLNMCIPILYTFAENNGVKINSRQKLENLAAENGKTRRQIKPEIYNLKLQINKRLRFPGILDLLVKRRKLTQEGKQKRLKFSGGSHVLPLKSFSATNMAVYFCLLPINVTPKFKANYIEVNLN